MRADRPDMDAVVADMALVLRYWPTPWEPDPHAPGTVYSMTGLHGSQARVADVRGWGYLTGALNLPQEEACAAQDALGRLIAALPALLAERKEREEEEGDLLGAVRLVPPGWWWSVCRCNLTCDASVGPDFRHPDCPREHIDPFDAGFHVELELPSTVGDALKEVCRQARAAISALSAPVKEPRDG